MTNRPIVAVGPHMQALLIDVDAIPREGETVLGTGHRLPLDGAKATSQAVAAARLGAPAAVVTLLGNDERGRWWRSFFQSEGIDIRFAFEIDGPTDIGIVMLPPTKVPAIVSVVDQGRQLSPTVVRRARELLESAAIVLCPLEAPQESVIEAFRLSQASEAVKILNPSPMIDIDGELLELADIVVLNEIEAAELAGETGDPAYLAGRLYEVLPQATVIVTAGEAGAYLAADQRVEHAPAPHVQEVVDTTGAGDAFLGALAARLWLGDDIRSAVPHGVRAGSFAVTRESTLPSFPNQQELADFTALMATS